MKSSASASSGADRRGAGVRAGLALMALAFLALAPGSLAQVSFDLGGTLSTELGVDVGGDFTVAAVCLELEGRGEVGSGFFPDAAFFAEVWGCYDAALAAGPRGGVPEDLSELLYGGRDPFSIGLGIAYATLYRPSYELSVGRQRVSWGSADALAPIDVVNPTDLSYPLAPPSDRKLASLMVRAQVDAPGEESVALDLVLVPLFEPSVMPGPAWQPDVVLPSFPPEAGIVGLAPPLDDRPEASLRNVQFGVRATFDLDLLDGTDASLTYFRGFKKLPTASFRLVPTGLVPGTFYLQPVLSYDRVHLLGFDFSSVAGAYVLRGDAAMTFTSDPDGVDPAVGNPSFQAVLGVERSLPGGAYLTAQLTYERVWPDAGSEAAVDVASVLALRLEPDALTTAQAAWLHGYVDGSGVLMPSLAYKLADGVTASVEGVLFYGRDGSRYGAWQGNSQLRLGVEYAF